MKDIIETNKQRLQERNEHFGGSERRLKRSKKKKVRYKNKPTDLNSQP